MNYAFSWIDYVVIAIPLVIVLYIGCRSRKYIRGVTDFLAAGRLGGRYVVAVASGESALGLVTVVASMDVMYNGGFAIGFWSRVGVPITMVLGLSGFCTYRFRETKALTLGQYLEMRYSRNFRILAAVLQSISGIMNYAIFPAVGGRFLMYYLNLPSQTTLWGWSFPTIGLLMASFLAVALFIVLLGGQITNMVTDCVQGLLSYPLYFLLLAYIFYRFSWFNEMAPALLDRPVGESFVNPFDVSKLKTFNLFYISYGLFVLVMNRISWSGSQGYAGAAKSAHEQKMAGLLGSWRSIFSGMIFTMLAIGAYTFLHHANYKPQADMMHRHLTVKALADVAPEGQYELLRTQISEFTRTGELGEGLSDYLAQGNLPPTREYSQWQKTAFHALNKDNPKKAQSFNAVYNQMTVITALRSMLPVGLVGAFCALMILLLISTDTTYMHSWGSILVQDIILPLRKTPFTVKGQLTALRIAICSVAVFIFLFSLLFQQNDYIIMFLSITGAIWYGGASTVLVLGLYWKRGTTLAAYITLIFGSLVALTGLFGQQYWAGSIYPALTRWNMVEPLDKFLRILSSPLHPYVNWQVVATEYPINSVEQNFITMVFSIFLYIGVSLCGKRVFNLDKMLHRGIYSDDPQRKNNRSLFSREKITQILVGIDDEYSRGDKILAWSVFAYSFGWMFVLTFLGVILWNYLRPWSNQMWVNYLFVTTILAGGVLGAITAVWFSWGGIRDLKQLFKDLKNHSNAENDNGSVVHSADDSTVLED